MKQYQILSTIRTRIKQERVSFTGAKQRENKNKFRSKERSCNRVREREREMRISMLREREIERDAYNYAEVEPAVGSRKSSGRS